jgi:hypothetical protein
MTHLLVPLRCVPPPLGRLSTDLRTGSGCPVPWRGASGLRRARNPNDRTSESRRKKSREGEREARTDGSVISNDELAVVRRWRDASPRNSLTASSQANTVSSTHRTGARKAPLLAFYKCIHFQKGLSNTAAIFSCQIHPSACGATAVPVLVDARDASLRNLRAAHCVKHHRRAARVGRTIDKSGKILTERARARGASPIATYFLAAL